MNSQATEAAVVSGRYLLILVGIMLGAGGLGGLVNYYLSRSEDSSKSSLKESLILGIAASFLVPLFLQMISSNLLRSGVTVPLDRFVFAGFCLVAAISSKAFMRTISDRVLREVGEAKKDAKQAVETAQEAKGAAASAENKAVYAEASAEPAAKPTEKETSISEELLIEMAREYVRIRATMDSGPARTAEMTRIFRQMTALASKTGKFPVVDCLREPDDQGRRLAAYAYLYTKPDFNLLAELVESVTSGRD